MKSETVSDLRPKYFEGEAMNQLIISKHSASITTLLSNGDTFVHAYNDEIYRDLPPGQIEEWRNKSGARLKFACRGLLFGLRDGALNVEEWQAKMERAICVRCLDEVLLAGCARMDDRELIVQLRRVSAPQISTLGGIVAKLQRGEWQSNSRELSGALGALMAR